MEEKAKITIEGNKMTISNDKSGILQKFISGCSGNVRAVGREIKDIKFIGSGGAGTIKEEVDSKVANEKPLVAKSKSGSKKNK